MGVEYVEKTKKLLENMALELLKVPKLKDIKKVMIGRDDKILNEIINPKDKLIKELYKGNLALHKDVSKQANIIDKFYKTIDLYIGFVINLI